MEHSLVRKKLETDMTESRNPRKSSLVREVLGEESSSSWETLSFGKKDLTKRKKSRQGKQRQNFYNFCYWERKYDWPGHGN